MGAWGYFCDQNDSIADYIVEMELINFTGKSDSKEMWEYINKFRTFELKHPIDISFYKNEISQFKLECNFSETYRFLLGLFLSYTRSDNPDLLCGGLDIKFPQILPKNYPYTDIAKWCISNININDLDENSRDAFLQEKALFLT